MPEQPTDTLTVSQLNRLAKQTLEDVFPQVRVVGELSNFSRPGSGHWYFNLKDDRAQIRCAMFKNRNFAVKFQPDAGQQVMVSGRISLYEARGDYQLIVDAMQPAGDGLLAMRFEQLKRELQAAGLFDAERKKPLPAQINHLAIVTSPTGAAIRDVLSVLARRWPMLRVSIIPVQVQGDAAAAQIVRALAWIEQLQATGDWRFDAVLLTRGGGSLEDLWPFNEKVVAEAIAAMSLPVVSAVGHEVDFSIADFVADLRAPTPSAAAELLSRDGDEVLARLRYLDQRMTRAAFESIARNRRREQELLRRLRSPLSRLRESAQRVDELEMRLQRSIRNRISRASADVVSLRRAMRHPGARLREQRQRLNQLHAGLSRSTSHSLSVQRREVAVLDQQLKRNNPRHQLPALREQVYALQQRQQTALGSAIRPRRDRVQSLTQLLQSLNPDQTLQRGYAIVRDAQGNILRSARTATSGDDIAVTLADGRIDATVTHSHTD